MTFDEEDVTAIMEEFVQHGILEIYGQSSDLRPSFRFTEKHLRKIIEGDRPYIRFIENKFNIECDRELVDIYKKMLKNHKTQTKLN